MFLHVEVRHTGRPEVQDFMFLDVGKIRVMGDACNCRMR